MAQAKPVLHLCQVTERGLKRASDNACLNDLLTLVAEQEMTIVRTQELISVQPANLISD
jgi:hypothetical protein